MGRFGALLRPPKPIGRKKLGSQKTLKNIRFFDDFGLLRVSLAGSVAASGRLVAIRTPHEGMMETM